MKKILASVALITAFTTTVSADLLRAEIGAGMWAQSPSGDLTAKNVAADVDKAKETENAQPYVWAMVKHFVPLVPNLRVEYASVTSDTIKIANTAIAGTELTYTQVDFIPYYNLLDNTFWLTLDVGVDVKSIQVKAKATGDETDSMFLPLGYVRTRVQVPLTGFGAEADVKYIAIGKNTVYDARVKVDYTFDIFPVVQPALEVGYRVQHFETEELLGVKMNMDFAGVYAGMFLRF
jgi:outer membrane protein